jgi:hypothetical protein
MARFRVIYSPDPVGEDTMTTYSVDVEGPEMTTYAHASWYVAIHLEILRRQLSLAKNEALPALKLVNVMRLM